MNENANVRNNVIWNTVGTMYYFACQWIIAILVVRISNYTLAGYLSLAMTITNSFYSIAQFGMRQFQVSDIKMKYSDKIYIGSRFVTMLIAFISCTVYSFVSNYDFMQVMCILTYMLLKLVEALVDVYQGINQKYWRFDVIGKSFIIRGTIIVVVFVLCQYFTQNLPLSLLLISVFSLFVVLFYDIRKTSAYAEIKGEIANKQVIKLLIECIPIVVFSFLLSLVTLIARNTLQEIEGVDRLGIYASVASPAVVIQLLASVIFNPFVPVFAEYYEKKENKSFCKLLIKFLAFMATLTVVAVVAGKLLGKFALVILIGKSIEPYVYLLIPVVLCTVVTAAIWLLSTILIAMRKTVVLLIATVISVIVAYLVSNKCVEEYSMNGVSYAIIIAGICHLVLMMLACVYSVWRNKK